MPDGARIVVGVDGSPSAQAALHWALGQAELTGAVIDAVIAWQYPAAAFGAGYGPVPVGDNVDFQGWAQKTLADQVAAAVPAASSVRVRAQVTEGSAASVLLAAADGADLLVTGSRGHGGFTEALLGSVSQHCVLHARCPVVVVRGDVA